MPQPSALKPGAAETPQVPADGGGGEPQPPIAAMDEEDEAGDGVVSTTPQALSPKRPHSPTPSSVSKLPRWRSPAVASSSGLGESQQSLPSPLVADSPMVVRAQASVESAVWKLTESLFVTLFDLSMRLPADGVGGVP